MYYDKILKIWVFDLLDYFLFSAIVGCLLAPRLKSHMSEKKAMERLKSSIIKKSKLVRQLDKAISKKIKIKRIYKFALGNHGGQLEEFQADHKFSNEAFKLAQKIQGLVENLALFLKEKELEGVATVFFKNGRLILGIILSKCKINVTYLLLNEGLSTKIIIITSASGGVLGFTIGWFWAGATLITTPLLISCLLIRSVTQQIVNLKDYSKFKMFINKMLKRDDELKNTLPAFFVEREAPTFNRIKMKPLDSENNPIADFNFDSNQNFEEFVKDRMKENLGLVENPTQKQLKEIINTRKFKNKPKGKTVYFKNFIKRIAEDSDGIIDAEIVKEAIKVKVKNEER